MTLNNNKIIATKPGDNNTWLGYTIALVTLGACIGNMFMAGKIRNVMKMKIPNPETFREGGSKRSSTNGTNTSSNSQTHEKVDNVDPFAHLKQRAAATIPDYIVSHLDVLKLPHKRANEAEIKAAYRKAVLQYHPDRMHLKDVAMKPIYEAKFKMSTDSYQALIDYYVKYR